MLVRENLRPGLQVEPGLDAGGYERFQLARREQRSTPPGNVEGAASESIGE
jgi:hypothetical protein